ncbi:MAG: nucleotidyltransferase domain-containing protein [Thermoactinomyces sp.]
MRLSPIQTAKKFVAEFYSRCEVAILGGSTGTGKGTETSDLDIVIFDFTLASTFRQSLKYEGWPIESFVYNNLENYRKFFESDRRRCRPALIRMVAEGIVLIDQGLANKLKTDAQSILDQGPEPWTMDQINQARYMITDCLDDLIGCNHPEEEIFIVHRLCEVLYEFVMRTNNKWLGTGKWMYRTLERMNKPLCDQMASAFDHYYRTREKGSIIQLADDLLEPYGGRFFEGFCSGI